MGIYVIGSLYNPRQSNIPWSQPGGPGTQVFPAQQINVPWGPPDGYPVPGQFFCENSGLWVAGCQHWMDYPRVFTDEDAFIVTLTYLKDTSGQTWLLGVTNSALIQTIPVGFNTNQTSILLNDTVTAQTWAVSVLTNGDIQLTSVASQPAQSQLLMLAPNGSLYAIQIANGLLETAYAEASEGQPTALITCAICSFIQYTMPITQFYNCVQTPITII